MFLNAELLISAIPALEEADKAYTSAVNRDALLMAQTDVFFQMGIENKEMMMAGWKGMNTQLSSYQGEMESLISDFQKGKITTGGAMSRFKGMSGDHYKKLFAYGNQAIGNPYYRDMGPTRRDLSFMSKARRTEMKFFRRFLSDIKNPLHGAPRGTIGAKPLVHPYKARAGYYAESGKAQFFNGMVAGAGQSLVIAWVKGTPKTETCPDCETLSARLWTWETLPTVPRGGDTQCLYRCYCSLEFRKKSDGKVFDQKAKSTAESFSQPGRYAKLYDSAGNEITGTNFQADLERKYAEMYKARQMIEVTTAETQLEWIAARRQLNFEIIDMMKRTPGYRAIPTVAVSDLVSAMKTASSAGGTLQPSLIAAVRDEVVFVRANYMAKGLLVEEAGQIYFKSPTGMKLAVNGETDIVFTLQPKWTPSGTESYADSWASGSAIKESMFHGTRSSSAIAIKATGFSPSKIGSFSGNEGYFGKGFYFTQDQTYAKAYGSPENMLTVRLNVKNICSEDRFMMFKNKAVTEAFEKKIRDEVWIMRRTTELIEKAGHDAVQVSVGGGVSEVCVFDPKNIMVVVP